jgi:hypothetical protein
VEALNSGTGFDLTALDKKGQRKETGTGNCESLVDSAGLEPATSCF